MARYTCKTCGAIFSTMGGFDKHRGGKYINDPPTYGRYCLTSEELGKRGYVRSYGVWILPGDAPYSPSEAL